MLVICTQEVQWSIFRILTAGLVRCCPRLRRAGLGGVPAAYIPGPVGSQHVLTVAWCPSNVPAVIASPQFRQ